MRVVIIEKLLVAMIVATVVGSLQAAESGGITAKAVQVIEFRRIDLGSTAGAKSLPFPPALVSNELRVRIRLSGEDIAKATHAKIVKLATVKDDAGSSLVLQQNPVDREVVKQLRRISRAGGSVHDIVVNLKSPRRAAKVIAELNGEISMKVATSVKEVIIPLADLSRQKKADRPFENAELKKLNIAVALTSFTSFEKGGTRMNLRFSGDGREAVFAVDLVNKEGKIMRSGFSVHGLRGKVDARMYAEGLLPPGVTSLRIQIALETKDIVVPIQLKNIPLP